MIAGQKYFDVFLTGGEISNVTLTGANIVAPVFSSPLALGSGGTGSALANPGADRVFFWDNSANSSDWLIVGAGLVITDKTLTVAGAGLGDVTGPMSATDNAISRFDGTTGKIIQSSGASIDDSGNITANNFSGTSSGSNTGDQTNITGNAGTVTTINGRLANGTGTTISGSGTAGSPYTVGINTTQSISKISNLTSNGIVSTSGGDGTLGVTAVTGSGSVMLASSPTASGATLTTTSVNGVTLSTAGNAGQSLDGTGSYASRVYMPSSQSATGTSVDFNSIPSWVKIIKINFSAVSTNGSANVIIQIGDSGGIEPTGYACVSATTAFTAGFGFAGTLSANTYHGSVTLTLLDAATFLWCAEGAVAAPNGPTIFSTAGSKSLSAALDRIRITTSNGTDTFDTGLLGILGY